MSKSVNRAIGVSLNALQSARRRGLPHSFALMAVGELNAARAAVQAKQTDAARMRLENALAFMQSQHLDENTFNEFSPRRRSYRETEKDDRKVAAVVCALTLICALAFSAVSFDPAMAKTAAIIARSF